MKTLQTLSVLSCVALGLAAAPLAHADNIVDGSVWEGFASNPILKVGPPVAPTDTFTVEEPSGSVFNLTAASSSTTLIQFLRSGGDDFKSTGGIGAGDPIVGDLFEFDAFIDLAPGTYSITHTGALYFEVGQVELVDSPDPAAGLSVSTFTIATDTGNEYYNMLFAETGTNGAQLGTSLTPTPEPSSFILLVSGLLAAGGAIRRRIAA